MVITPDIHEIKGGTYRTTSQVNSGLIYIKHINVYTGNIKQIVVIVVLKF